MNVGLLKHSKNPDTSADSFIPILIYVVLKANPDNLVSNVQYILRFRNQDKLGGEAGYYLSSLVSNCFSISLTLFFFVFIDGNLVWHHSVHRDP